MVPSTFAIVLIYAFRSVQGLMELNKALKGSISWSNLMALRSLFESEGSKVGSDRDLVLMR